MQHEDGHCDGCGCEIDVVQLTVDGRELCEACVAGEPAPRVRVASKPEARDDAR